MFEQYPLIFFSIEYCAFIPMHTVDYERVFSCLKLIKMIRNGLLMYNVSNIWMVKIEDTGKGLFSFQVAFLK